MKSEKINRNIEFYTGREYEYDLVDKLNIKDPAFMIEYRRLQELAKKEGCVLLKFNILWQIINHESI